MYPWIGYHGGAHNLICLGSFASAADRVVSNHFVIRVNSKFFRSCDLIFFRIESNTLCFLQLLNDIIREHSRSKVQLKLDQEGEKVSSFSTFCVLLQYVIISNFECDYLLILSSLKECLFYVRIMSVGCKRKNFLIV